MFKRYHPDNPGTADEVVVMRMLGGVKVSKTYRGDGDEWVQGFDHWVNVVERDP